MASFVLSFSPLDVLDEIWDLIESVSEEFLTYFSFRFLTRVRSSSYSPMAVWIFLAISSLVTWSLYEMFNSLR